MSRPAEAATSAHTDALTHAPTGARTDRSAAAAVSGAAAADGASAASGAAATTAAVIAPRNLPLLLLMARERVIARFRPILNAHGITEQQWRIVRALLELGPQEQRQIGELCRISSPSLAGVLARMDDLGLVQRERLPHDQRRVRVRLTDTSLQLATTMAPQIEATYRQLSEQIGAERLGQLYGVLDEVIALLGGPPASADEAGDGV